MNHHSKRFAITLCILAAHCSCIAPADELVENQADHRSEPFHGALLAAGQVTDSRLEELQSAGVNAVAIALQAGSDNRTAANVVCKRIMAANLKLVYWIEVARCPELADAHPEWMASLQGHQEWRRLFRDPPTPGNDEVVKTYPWVPILNQEPFAAQVDRVRELLKDRPLPACVFLNDIQGAPSACGCGNHLCRWTSDYGKKRTTTPLGNDAPAAFINAVQQMLPDSRIIPVWTTECEEHDGHAEGLCAGVGCFKGICWKAWTEQLAPVAGQCRQLGVLLPYRAFQRDIPAYGAGAGWVHQAVTFFQTMPVHHQKKPVSTSRLITVLQGWDVTDQQIAAQTAVAVEAGAAGVLMAYTPIEQDWQPRLVKLDSGSQ